MEISLQDYWMGRDKLCPKDLTTDICANAELTVKRVNLLLARAQAAGVVLPKHPGNKSHVSSGWRPPAINAATKNAAVRSNHVLGKACDIYDPDGKLDAWLFTAGGHKALTDIGLWAEHPLSTPDWSHVQTVPPKSGNLFFYP